MRINDGFICKRVLDNDILIDINNDSKAIYKLNETSKYIYDLVKENKTLDEIINSVKDKYNIDIQIAKQDVTEFINKLKELKVIID